MRSFLGATIIALTFVFLAMADQRDPRLDPLFEELKTAASVTDARYIEREIWGIWSEHGADVEAEMRFNEGLLLMNAGQLEQAIRLFSIVIDVAPEFAEAWNKRATLLYFTGDYAGSVRDIERTLALEPRHFGALSGLGLIYQQLESPDGAIKAFRAALDINPHMPHIKERLDMLMEAKAGKPL
ncbi:MAG: tetratricopeptide repeat protein [Nisaea sp.]|uniref:tetratricopeptide repeat protein n=1 Tax=Nisaea sp. TaxID=2024842 RepID=UPI001B2841FE|nr:tetratricopeptide repeat protein [Nisaea sp.]MBO6562340.1 tetratricopeptide repeat protein [Nisaea sp.]